MFYDEVSKWPELDYLPDGKVRAKRWWWPPDRKKAKLLTVVINSPSFKKNIKFEFTPPAKHKEDLGV